METVGVYVDSLSLFDVRKGIILRILEESDLDEDIIKKKISRLWSIEHNFRKVDDFSDIIDMQKYEDIFKNKLDIHVFKYSTITGMLSIILKRLMINDKRNNILESKFKKPVLYLNIYPFKLSSKVINDIPIFLRYKLSTFSLEINILNMREDEVSLNFMKNLNITDAYMYDFSRWINSHGESISKIKNPNEYSNISLYFPDIGKIKLTDEEEESLKKHKITDLFSFVRLAFAHILNINFLPICLYSDIIISGRIMKLIDRNQENITKSILKTYVRSDIKDDIDLFKDISDKIDEISKLEKFEVSRFKETKDDQGWEI